MLIRIQNVHDWAVPLLGTHDQAKEMHDSLNLAPPWERATFVWESVSKTGAVILPKCRVEMEAFHIDRERFSDIDVEGSDVDGGWAAIWEIYIANNKEGEVMTLSNNRGEIVRMTLASASQNMSDFVARILTSKNVHITSEDREYSLGELLDEATALDAQSEAAEELMLAVIRSYVLIFPWLAITLCHMKGTELEEVYESKKATKYRTRKGKPREHVIVIAPGPRRRLAAADTSRKASQEIRSIVRGHFKRYTEERPLLGKHVGTFWWSPQLRGADDGQYDVKAPKDGPEPG